MQIPHVATIEAAASLTAELTLATRTLGEALIALLPLVPNQDHFASAHDYAEAHAQHTRRVEALAEVAAEVQTLTQCVRAQRDAFEARPRP